MFGAGGGCSLQQLQLTRLRDRAGAVAHLELAEDLIEMPLRRADRGPQLVGDLLVRRAYVEKAQDLALRFAERLVQRGCHRFGFLRQSLEQAADELRRDMADLREHRTQTCTLVEEYPAVASRRRERYGTLE